MRPVVVALLGLGVACGAGDDGPTIPDPYTRPSLGSANPGVQLSVHAPQSYAEWPVIGWDLEHNALVLPDRPREAPTNLVRLDLDHHTTALLRTAPNGVQELHTGGSGTVLFSSTAGKLSSSDAEIAPISEVRFAVSDNAQWVAFADDGGWHVLELSSGNRTALPSVPGHAIAVSNDGSRVAFGQPRSSSAVSIVTVATQAVETLATGDQILDAVFAGAELHLLTGKVVAAGQAPPSYRFFDRWSSTDSTALGVAETVMPNGGFPPYFCGAWSHGAEPRVAVAAVPITFYIAERNRHNFLRLGDAAELVGSADLYAATDCSLSPDARWFVYGDPTGNLNTGRLFLKKIR